MSMSLPTHEDMKLFIYKYMKIWQYEHHNEQHHEQQLMIAYWRQRMQEESCWENRGRTKLQAQVDPLVMKANLET